MDATLVELATAVQLQIRERLPAIDDVEEYAKGLTVYQVESPNKRRRHVVLAWQPEDPVEQRLSNRQLRMVHVSAKRGVPPSPQVLVLIQHSPWHPAALPFKPKKKEATFTFEPVGVQAAQKVLHKNVKARREWRPPLVAAGVRPPPMRAILALGRMKRKEATSADANEPSGFSSREAWRLEFGYGRHRATPIWRPILRGVVRRGLFGIIKPKYNPLQSFLKGKLRRRLKPERIAIEKLPFKGFAKVISANL